MVYLPLRIYRNVKKFLEYRGLKAKKWLDDETFITDIQWAKYIKIDAMPIEEDRNNKRERTHIFLLDEKSKYAASAQPFELLLRKVQDIKKSKEFMTIIIISENTLSTHIQKKIRDYRSEKVRIEHYPYSVFKIEIPKHNLVPEHRILSQKEAQNVLGMLRIRIENLPKIIHSTDPQAIWHGCRPGDIVEITRVSEISGREITYRTVI